MCTGVQVRFFWLLWQSSPLSLQPVRLTKYRISAMIGLTTEPIHNVYLKEVKQWTANHEVEAEALNSHITA